jgi:hypothetical protein
VKEYEHRLRLKGMPESVVAMRVKERIARGKKQKTDTWRRTIAGKLSEAYDISMQGLIKERNA